MKALVIDTSSAVRSALTSILEKFGADTIIANDGIQAIEIVSNNNINLIITEIEIPRLNGLSLCRKLKGNPAWSAIPIIILSGYDEKSIIEESYRAGASAYINKSDAHRILEGWIERLLLKSGKSRDRRLLVVDDSKSVRELIHEALTNERFSVTVSENGLEAISLIKKQKPDLIVTDIKMPVMGGMAMCEALQSDMRWQDIPLIIMSVVSDISIMRRMIRTGASAYLVKPFNIYQLVVTVEKVLADRNRLLIMEKIRFDAEKRLMLGSITSLIQALEARDKYTRGHSDSVAEIVVSMARKMGFNPSDIEEIDIAGKLHDIGKIGIRDDLLLKAGRLTAEEFMIIRSHPVIGAEILRPIPSLKRIIPAVLHHHERFDGQGYPDGLKGERIPLWARMIFVADTYHALISDRPYRKGMPRDIALQTIKDSIGTQLCPDCAKVFLEIYS